MLIHLSGSSKVVVVVVAVVNRSSSFSCSSSSSSRGRINSIKFMVKRVVVSINVDNSH